MKSAGAIAFELRPSRLLGAALVTMTGLALAALWLSGLYSMTWLAIAATGLVLLVALRAWLRLHRLHWRRAGWNADGAWSLLDATQAATGAQLLGWSTFGLALLLRLRSDAGETVTLYLLPDNLDRDTRRRLRVRLAQDRPLPQPPSFG